MFRNDHVRAFMTPSAAERTEIWPDAAELVSVRWQLFLDAEGESRSWAFASYLAALDAEEAAAADLAALALPVAA
jgi:hypothetical protein